MNNRIRELIRQAESTANEGIGFDGQEYLDMLMERFAELIVQECLEIAKNREDEFESAGLLEQSNAVGNVAYRISRQFGVKR
jgi:homoserine kinase